MLAAEISTTRPTRTLWVRAAVVAVISLIAAMLGFASPTYAASGPATFVSDQADYPPGGTVVLTGDNWAAGESVHITVNDDAGQTWSLSSGTGTAPADPVANDTGSFSYTFSLPAWFVANYTATATGATTGTLTTTFTDSAIQLYDQCANGTSGVGPICNWTNGNLQTNNSNYAEGDATVQRLVMDGLVPGSSHTVTVSYLIKDGTKHAYDYLTTWDYSEDWITLADRCSGIANCTTQSETTYPIPNDPTIAFDGGQVFTMRGGTVTATSPVQFNTYQPDYNSVQLTFTVPNNSTMCAKGVCTSVLWFGAHAASILDWAPDTGASSFNGSSFHVRITEFDGGSVGNRDNQMSADAVRPNGTITIVKDAVPNDTQNFKFTLQNTTTGASQNFTLDDDSGATGADATYSTSKSLSVGAGSYTVVESATADWTLTNLVCINGSGNTSSVSLADGKATISVVSGVTTTCTYTNKFGYKDLVVSKTATASYDRSYTWTIAKSVDKTTVNATSGGTATFNYTVTATPTAHDSNFKVSGTITVTNPNPVPVPAVTLADSMTDGTCSITGTTSNITVAAGATVTFPYNCTFTSKPTGTQTNTATATWTAGSPFGTTGTASGTATADFSKVSPTVTGGQTITVTDDKTDPANPVVLGTADASIPSSQKFPYSLTKTAPNGKCDTYTNTAWLGGDTTNKATATVTVCGAAALTVTKSATPSFTRSWAWTVDKVGPATQLIADPSNGDVTAHYTVTASATSTDSGWTVSGTIHIANPNSVAVPITSVTDAMTGSTAAATCTITSPVPSSLAANDSVDLAYTCTYATNPGTGTLTNTATVNYGASGFVAAGSASVSVTTTFGGLLPATQTGDTTTVSDPNAPEGTFPASVAAPGGSWSYDVTWNVGTAGTCQPFTNTATLGTGASDSADVTACRAADLAVTKTATGSYDTTYLWDVSKTLDASVPGSAPAGTTVPLPYAVVATKIGQTDAAWVIKGTITVTNPNTWEPVTLQSVSDSLSVDGATCTISGDQTATIAAGATAIFDYTCSYASKPASYSGTNTATVTWDKPAAHTATGSASGAADYTMALTKETDKTVTVVDTFNGGDPVQVGTADISESPKTLPVDRSIALPSGTCVKVTNIATITGDAGTTLDTASVDKTICGGANLTVSKTAEAGYTQTYPWSVTKDASRPTIVVAEGGNTEVTYTVTPTVSAPTPTAWTLTGTITVSNPNDWESITAQVSDAVDITGLTCSVADGTDVVVAASSSVTLDYTCTVDDGVNPGTLSGRNTATATWDKGAASTSADSASGEADVVGTLTDSVNETVPVMDSMFGGQLGTATAGGTLTATGAGVTVSVDGKSFVYTKTLTGTAGECQTIDNEATITGTDASATASVNLCIVKALTASKSGAGTFTRTYKWTISKDVDTTRVDIAPDGTATFHYTVTATQGTPVDSGWALSGTITVTNPNAFAATATVTDTLAGCTLNGTATNTVTVDVPGSDSTQIGFQCTGLASAITSNRATVSWTATTDAGDLEGDTSANGSGFAYTETESVDKSIEVWDNETGPDPISLGTAEWGDGTTPVTFEYQVTKSGADIPSGTCATYDNKAWVDTAANDSSDTQQVKVCVGADLEVSKTATTSFTRHYAWTIDKTVDDANPKIPAGSSVTSTYNIAVTKAGYTDSAWTVKGTITVKNPNDWQAITADVTDALDNGGGGSCVITSTGGGVGVVILAGSSVDLNYECTFTSQPDYSGTNTATATWDKGAAHTANGSAMGTAAANFVTPTEELDRTITVTDTPKDGATTTLGELDYLDAPDTTNYPVKQTYEGVAGTCTTYTNTAEIVQTKQSDTQDVSVCVGKDLTVTKDVTANYKTEYFWSIDKSVDPASQTVPAGTPGAFGYDITVSPDGKRDYDWSLTGTITVTNPNDWEDITADVTDQLSLGIGGMCTVEGGVAATIPAGESKSFTYTCGFTGTPDLSGKNTAYATWSETTAATPTGTAFGDADVTMEQIQRTNDTVTVTDSLTGETYGSFDWTKGVQHITYTLHPTGTPGSCTSYNNTARIVETTGDEASATAELCVGSDVKVTKKASGSYDRTYLWSLDKSVDSAAQNIGAGETATFSYSVTATPQGYADSNWTMGGTITVTNPNDFQAVTVDVTDVPGVGGGATCTVANGTGVVIEAGGQVDLDYTCTVPSQPTSYTDGSNSATATVTSGVVPTTEVAVTADVTFALANETDKTVVVTDDKTEPGASYELGTATWNAAGTTTTFPYSLEKSGTVGKCETYTNTAVLQLTGDDLTDEQKVQLCVGADLTVSKTVVATYDRDYNWSITKSVTNGADITTADPTWTSRYAVTVKADAPVDSNWKVVGTITVTNTNDWPVEVNLTDVIDNGGVCTVEGDGTHAVTAPANSTVSADYECTYSSAPTTYTDGTNTVTATWDKAKARTATDKATFEADVDFAIANETDRTVTVDDPQAGNELPVTLDAVESVLPATITYGVVRTTPAGTCETYPNTATLSTDNGTVEKADASVRVCVGADLTVEKTATAGYDRTYAWTVDKTAGPARQVVREGEQGSFDYTVTAKPTGYTDSGWTMGGTITVTNPNLWQDVEVSVADVTTLGATCTIDGNVPTVTVPKNDKVVLGYTCVFGAEPKYTGTNTATVTWDATAAHTPTASASDTVDFTAAVKTETNKTVTVTDSRYGTLGEVTYPDTLTKSYSLLFDGTAGKCDTYDNTASVESDGSTLASDSASVELCVAKDLTVAKAVDTSFTRTYGWTVTKSADDTTVEVAPDGSVDVHYTVTATPDGYTDSRWTMTGTVTVTNPNEFTALTATVSDLPSIGGGAVCTVAYPAGGDSVTVPAGQSVPVNYTCTFDSQPTYTGGDNSATVTWTLPTTVGGTDTVTDTVPVVFSAPTLVNDVVKVYDDWTVPGESHYIGDATWADGPAKLTYALPLPAGTAGTCQDFTNTAVVDVAGSTDPTATETVTVCTGADLTVEKTATATFTRDYNWTITKTVEEADVKTSSESVTSQYTVVVDAAPAVDSAWVVTGTITVHNPNGWDIEAEVTDAVGLGGSCLVDGTAATTVTVPANDQATVSYECTFASKPTSYTGRNTAVVTWDAAKAHTASGTAEGYADFAFALTKEIDRSVTVADAQAGATLPVTLDAVTSTLPASFEYGVERVTPAGTCKTYPNTATVTASDGEAHSAGASVTVCVGADLTVKKTAEGSFHRTYKWTVDKTVVGNATKTVGEGTTGMFDYSVTVKPDGYVDSAWELSGTITVTNPNTWEDIDATVADLVNIGGNASCVVDGEGAVTIKAGTSVELPYTCTIPNQPNYSGLNTATATWDGAKYFTPTGTAVGTANVEIALSGTTNETVHVTDSRHDDLGSVTWPNTLTKAYSLTFTGVPGTCTTYPNTATITETQQSDSAEVTLCVGKDVTIAKTAAGTYTTTYPWTVTKKADKTRITTKPDGTATFTYTVVATPGTPVDSAWALTGTITVTNPNDFQPVMVDVTDVAGVGGGAVCTVAGGTGVTLAANETKKLDYSCTFTSQPGYTKSNTATAKVVSGTTASTSVSSTVPAPFSVTREIDKTVAVYDDLAQPGSWVKIGDATGSTPVTFTYPVDHPAATPGTCQAYTNTARVDLELATDPIAKATVEVCTGAPLTVTKTATATYTRTYLWAIAKTTPTPSPAATLNSTLGVPYTVTVTPNGYADSAFTTIGTITVTNPNDWESVTVKSVTDTLDSSLGGTCTVTGLTATNAVLAKSGGSVTLDYSCTYADPPSAYTGTNTATATWDAAAAYTASGSASGTAPVNFALTKEVNKTVSVTDKAVITGTTTTASGLKTLGTATWNATGTPTVFTYTNTYTVPKNGCTSYTNTATIKETYQKSSVTVQVCGPPWLGDGTIGFWQNTNGQSIIKKTGVVPGTTTCLLTPWLRTFKPFQDLSATATCTAAATYVYNVIKAANASGASMNAMLKAQMLAAALNYYFTEVDPRRSAPSGSLGDMVFDIRPWSGAFGGATSMTLLQMLQYASGQSNAGGSVWYGQVKATQTLAKDAFAAVNMSRILLAP